ncbi:hypothetical protein VN97_g12910 [Penicillium thymicola]|uniref:Uncharacterized protein n=1 Tax=Penicillium thymicola TaxID=293382 RepID=A0AAI9T581_PENTH|nr:hypothetical protein VN97_g12910 [Penicillium thymicola]
MQIRLRRGRAAKGQMPEFCLILNWQKSKYLNYYNGDFIIFCQSEDFLQYLCKSKSLAFNDCLQKARYLSREIHQNTQTYDMNSREMRSTSSFEIGGMGDKGRRYIGGANVCIYSLPLPSS